MKEVFIKNKGRELLGEADIQTQPEYERLGIEPIKFEPTATHGILALPNFSRARRGQMIKEPEDIANSGNSTPLNVGSDNSWNDVDFSVVDGQPMLKTDKEIYSAKFEKPFKFTNSPWACHNISLKEDGIVYCSFICNKTKIEVRFDIHAQQFVDDIHIIGKQILDKEIIKFVRTITRQLYEEDVLEETLQEIQSTVTATSNSSNDDDTNDVDDVIPAEPQENLKEHIKVTEAVVRPVAKNNSLQLNLEKNKYILYFDGNVVCSNVELQTAISTIEDICIDSHIDDMSRFTLLKRISLNFGVTAND